jgi:beta-glucanase (GH16 family)
MKISFYLPILFLVSLWACQSKKDTTQTAIITQNTQTDSLVIKAESYLQGSQEWQKEAGQVVLNQKGWLVVEGNLPTAGRYSVAITGTTVDTCTVWVEYYIDNPDGRTYNVTGNLVFLPTKTTQTVSVDGSPFKAGKHHFKIHTNAPINLDKIQFALLAKHQATPKSLTQNTTGKDWELVWSDEFDNTAIDTSKWTYDIGNWGWGNNELQYYTQNRQENARIENGVLLIEARKNDMGQAWTSARLTTRGKVSFLYGKIEFRAKVPKEKGNWAAGWTLGDSYIDEIDWPYCGEIDILESVGYEVNEKGDGIAHATVHTPAYYFKINNQISSEKSIKKIGDEFHTYAVEWTPSTIRAFVDGQPYYLYDKNANEREFPFTKPQNLILNLAMGGGWGGAKGMDSTVTSQKFLIDYVRVYQRK